MGVLAWIGLGLFGAVLMAGGSRIALREVVALSERMRLAKFVVGVTIVALGTDLPEIVNSIVSSRLGHGDVNLGDSIGSVLAQATLVLGLLPFATRRPLAIGRREVAGLAIATVVLLGLGAALASDGHVSRIDAALLIGGGLAALASSVRSSSGLEPDPPRSRTLRHPLQHAALAFAALAGVAAGATLLVRAVVATSLALGAPEYALAFFAAALGTSLPELVVNLTAMRRGERAMALGGVLGACLLDASVSAGIGPLLFPTDVSSGAAIRGAAAAAAGTALAAVALLGRGRHDRATGALLLTLYALALLSLVAR